MKKETQNTEVKNPQTAAVNKRLPRKKKKLGRSGKSGG